MPSVRFSAPHPRFAAGFAKESIAISFWTSCVLASAAVTGGIGDTFRALFRFLLKMHHPIKTAASQRLDRRIPFFRIFSSQDPSAQYLLTRMNCKPKLNCIVVIRPLRIKRNEIILCVHQRIHCLSLLRGESIFHQFGLPYLCSLKVLAMNESIATNISFARSLSVFAVSFMSAEYRGVTLCTHFARLNSIVSREFKSIFNFFVHFCPSSACWMK